MPKLLPPVEHAAAQPAPAAAAKVRVATATGGATIVLWSTLAVLTTLSGSVPPFQLVAMAFALAASLAIGKWLMRGEPVLAHLRWPTTVWLVGVGGLFAYHVLYFLALRTAPAVEASLINYLWPLLIVVFSALLPRHRLRWWHLAGALSGLAGMAILVGYGGDEGPGFRIQFLPGYIAALAAAVTWAGYSILSRRYAAVPTDAVGGFCAATALLVGLAHLAFENTVWPSGVNGWPLPPWASARSGSPSLPGITASSTATSGCLASLPMPRPCSRPCFLSRPAGRGSPGHSPSPAF